MKEFFDTSVLVAAFWSAHPGHDASNRLVSAAKKKTSACARHSLAELYEVMTALPVKDTIVPEQALLFVEEARARLTIVSLDQDEYVRTIEQAAARGFTGGRIYDALLLGCAAKCGAEAIYTWNLKHFRALDPALANKTRTP